MASLAQARKKLDHLEERIRALTEKERAIGVRKHHLTNDRDFQAERVKHLESERARRAKGGRRKR